MTADLGDQVTVTASEAARPSPAAARSATDPDSSSPVQTAGAHAAEPQTATSAAPVAAAPQSSAGSGAAQHAEPVVAAHGERGGQDSGAAGLAGAGNALLVAALADGLEREMLLVVRRVLAPSPVSSPPPPSIMC